MSWSLKPQAGSSWIMAPIGSSVNSSAAVGCPLAGDWLYGTEEPELITRPALHSYELWLTHPITGAEIHCTAPLPEDMKGLISTEKPL